MQSGTTKRHSGPAGKESQRAGVQVGTEVEGASSESIKAVQRILVLSHTKWRKVLGSENFKQGLHLDKCLDHRQFVRDTGQVVGGIPAGMVREGPS